VNNQPQPNVSSILLVVCERTGEWAMAIRRTASRSFATVISPIETRSLEECRRRLIEPRTTSAGVPLAIEISFGTAAGVCELLAWHVRRFGDAPRMVVAPREMVGYEAVVREAGATLFTASLRDLRPCTAEYLRFRDDPAHVPLADERTPAARIRDSLPWRALRESAGG